MQLKTLRTRPGFLILTLLVLLIAACGNEPENTAPQSRPADSGSFTFFDISKDTSINNRQRKNLEKILGDEAVERRGIVNLEMNHKTFLQDHFPDLDRLNRQLNSEIGLRVKHRIVRLMYRYAKQKGLPYDLVELIFSEKTKKPLLVRLQFKTGAADARKALEAKHGPPRNLEWGRENASSRVWEKGGDYLFYSVVPKRGNKVEYRIAIYFTGAIEALTQSEKVNQKAGKSGKTGF